MHKFKTPLLPLFLSFPCFALLPSLVAAEAAAGADARSSPATAAAEPQSETDP